MGTALLSRCSRALTRSQNRSQASARHLRGRLGYWSGCTPWLPPRGGPPVRRGAVVVPGLVEPLSARELEVLRLLAAGKPNRLIAEELVVTLETVKKHVSHVFDKLGAANRTQAIARAQELGLVS